MTELRKRALGAYYTPVDAAGYMARWIARDDDSTALEPCFGDGVFIRAVRDAWSALGNKSAIVHGVELDPDTYASGLKSGLIAPEHATCADFLSVATFPVDAVIGNPPYVRLQNVDTGSRERALSAVDGLVPGGMAASASMWMPVVMHATGFIKIGGRMAWVLPYEATHVKYAKPFWQYLGKNFRSVEVVRVRERLFPSISQDVVILLAEGKGGTTTCVAYSQFATRDDMLHDHAMGRQSISLMEIENDQRPFERALVDPDVLGILERLEPDCVRLSDLLKIRIGYVAGDKAYFHPSEAVRTEFKIDETCLIPALASGRELKGVALRTSEIREPSKLFWPKVSAPGSERYIAYGVENGVHNRYKCRVRDPWYQVPLDSPPDIIFSVFGDSPRLVVNDVGLQVSNSLISARLRASISPERLVAGWYNSLTRLSMELNIHSLGGGVLVVIPGELGRVMMYVPERIDHLNALAKLVGENRIEEAYELGDRMILREELGLQQSEIDSLRLQVRRTISWRKRKVS